MPIRYGWRLRPVAKPCQEVAAEGADSAPHPIIHLVSPRAPSRRVHEIDGVRGWAALSVIVFHLFWELFGGEVPTFRNAALRFWLDGPLAVYVFFVLSGDALSWPFFASGNARVLDRTVVKRYFRLAIPIFYSSLIGYLLMRAGLTFNHQAGAALHSEWLAGFLSFDPSLASLANFSFSRVFFDFADYPNSYNRFLWPMPIELAGSFAVFAWCYGTAHRPQALRLVLAAVAIAWTVSEYYSLFFAGVAFAMLRRRGLFERLRASLFGRVGAPLLIAVVVAVDTIDYARGWYLNDTTALPGRFNSLLAIALVFSVYSNRMLADFFGNQLSRLLGRLSFPIYLLHFIVLCSLTSILIVRAQHAGMVSGPTYAAIASVSVLITLAAAWLFERAERVSLKAVDRVVKRVLEEQGGIEK